MWGTKMTVYICECCHSFSDDTPPVSNNLILCSECNLLKYRVIETQIQHFLKYHREYVFGEIHRLKRLGEH